MDEDLLRVGTGDTRETVEEDRDAVARVEVGLDRVEGENVLKEGDVGLDGVDDLNLERANLELAERSKVDLGKEGKKGKEKRKKRQFRLEIAWEREGVDAPQASR